MHSSNEWTKIMIFVEFFSALDLTRAPLMTFVDCPKDAFFLCTLLLFLGQVFDVVNEEKYPPEISQAITSRGWLSAIFVRRSQVVLRV